MDFPVTRRLIDTLPQWIDQLAGALPAPTKVPAKPSGFRWDHPIHNAEVVQVAKAVRMASGIAAALRLADLGLTVECATLLRTVSDFASEIIFLAEGLLEGRMVAAQSKFIEDHFKPLPSSPDELAEREREYFRRVLEQGVRLLCSRCLCNRNGALHWKDAPLHDDGA